MNKLTLGLLIGLLLGVAGAWFVLKSGNHEVDEPKAEEKKESGPLTISRKQDGTVQIALNPETQSRIGLVTAAVVATNLPSELSAFGRVLDPSALFQQLTDIRTATASFDVSRSEHDRLKTLFAQNQNASARALEAATMALERDQALREAAQVRLLTMWGPAIARRDDLTNLVASLNSQQSSLVRLDLPIGVSIAGNPVGASVAGLAAESTRFPAEILGPTPTADPLVQGQGFFALLRTNVFAPGATVLGWLTTANGDVSGVVIPHAAVVRHVGDTFVYVEIGTNTFERRKIVLSRPLGDHDFVREGLTPQQRVVIAGAQLLLSDELKGQGGEE